MELQKIFWKNGEFRNKKNNQVIVIPIGTAKIFKSLDRMEIHPMVNPEPEYTAVEEALKKYAKEDESYLQVNAYMLGEAMEIRNEYWYHISVTFYKIEFH
ncbi:TPA: hypothetical protein DCZ39_07120 [Patescibacteria group bacterium]|nr:hypothetical protein [Candidatus Gracilibacteria bacterium]